jgi:monoamine oxidase
MKIIKLAFIAIFLLNISFENVFSQTLSNCSVIIIGGGVAGLSAASRLHSRGCRNIIILEAQSRLGGRVHTIPFQSRFLEFGAQWIHGGSLENPVGF